MRRFNRFRQIVSGAALLALRTLRAEGTIRAEEQVVLFSTGGNKYH